MANNVTKIKVVIDPSSFSSYEKISGSLSQLQKDLNDLLAKHPLKVEVQAKMTDVKGQLESLKEEIASIQNISNIQVIFDNQEVLSQLNAVEGKLQEIHKLKNLDVRISYENIEKAAQQVSAELKAAFSKLGDADALQSLDQIAQRLENIPGLAKNAAKSAATQMSALHEGSKTTSTAIGKVSDRLTRFGDVLLKYADVSTFENFATGAEKAGEIIDSLSKKLKSERLNLVGQLDVRKTAEAIKYQITGSDSVVASSIRGTNAFVHLTGTLDAQKTAIEIGRVLRTEMSQALAATSNKVELTSEGISVENEQTAEKSIEGFAEKFRAVKKLFEELKNNDIRSLFAEWNASFATLNIPDSTIKSLEKVSTTLTQISKALKTLNTPATQIETTTFDSSVNGQINQAVSNAKTQVKNGTQITVTVSSQQVAEAINFAVANVDATKINKVSVPAQITNLSEAVNEAIVQAHRADSPMASLPIIVDILDLGQQVTDAINQLNNTPDALPKIKLAFDVDLAGMSGLVTQAQDAVTKLEQLIAQSAGRTANTGDVSKRVADMSRAVNTANRVLKQFEQEQKAALAAGQGGESKDYTQLEQQIVAAEQALKNFKKIATTGSREDALKFYDNNDLADTVSQIRTLTTLVKDFYKVVNSGGGQQNGGQGDLKLDSKMNKWEAQLNQWNVLLKKTPKTQTGNIGIDPFGLTEAIARLNELKRVRQELIALQNQTIISDADKIKIKDLQEEIDRLTTQLDQFVSKTKQSRSVNVGNAKEVDKLAKLQERLNDYVEKYESRLRRFPKLWQEVKDIQAKIAAGGDSIALQREMDSVIMRARSMGVETENIFTKIWERVGFNFRSMVASQGIMLVTSSLRDIYNNVKDLDTAMTELKKVTDGTAFTYTKFLEDATERAQNLGASLVDVVSASADFARLGYSIDDSAMLSDAALIYLNVGDDVDSIEDSTKALISTMQGFGIEASNVMSIVDKFNEVSNKYASSAGRILPEFAVMQM